MKVWILTRDINEYDQDGEYFVEVFLNKPTHQQLTACGVPTNRLRDVLVSNGNNKYLEDYKTYYLREREAF